MCFVICYNIDLFTINNKHEKECTLDADIVEDNKKVLDDVNPFVKLVWVGSGNDNLFFYLTFAEVR